MNGPIKTAVFPVAGLGTRFLPATKASPKEMLPVVDKPLIQYAVEEAVDAGMTQMVFITGRNKRAIEDHFDKAFELETELESRGREALLESIRNIVPKHVSCIYVRQPEALGLGHAVLCAKPVVGDEPFAVILADDLIDGTPSTLQQMVEVFKERKSSVLGVQKIPREESNKYGVIRGVAWRRGSTASTASSRSRSPPTRRRISRSSGGTS
jgi:UTP--glucose-1-phosphate uridylyltransferase